MELITILCILFATILLAVIIFYNQIIARIKKEQFAKEKQIEEKNLRDWQIFLSSLETSEQEKIYRLITKKNNDRMRAQQIFENRDFGATEDINWAYRQFKESKLWEFLSKFEELKHSGEA